MAQPTAQVMQAIQLIHEAIAIEPEPEDKATLGQCLTALMRLQAKNMAESRSGSAGGQQPAAGGAMMGGMGGGYHGSPPSGPQTPADPRLFLGG